MGLGGRRGKGGGRRRQPEGEGRGGVADNARDVGERAVAARSFLYVSLRYRFHCVSFIQ